MVMGMDMGHGLGRGGVTHFEALGWAEGWPECELELHFARRVKTGGDPPETAGWCALSRPGTAPARMGE